MMIDSNIFALLKFGALAVVCFYGLFRCCYDFDVVGVVAGTEGTLSSAIQ